MGDMSALREAVGCLCDDELARIKELHGETYASIHEAYGVLAEELYEARHEVKALRGHVKDLLEDLPEEDVDDICCDLNEAWWRAINAACELIQVAAVCKKARDGMGGGSA